MQSQLEATELELEKQRTLNEKLETDLLQMDQRKPDGGINGSHSPANGASTPADVLAGLDLGKKAVSGRIFLLVCLDTEILNRTPLQGARPFHSHPRRTLLSSLS